MKKHFHLYRHQLPIPFPLSPYGHRRTALSEAGRQRPARTHFSPLERRPDILSAEQALVAANARIGEAKALLFPNIRLTGVAGWESAALKSLFSAHASFWDLLHPGVTQPLFNAGRLRAGVRVTEAQQQEALQAYKKAIQQAFREVSDALVGVRRLREVRLEAKKQFQALAKQTIWPTSAISAASPPTWKSWTPTASSSRPNSASPKSREMNSWPSSPSTDPWAAADRPAPNKCPW